MATHSSILALRISGTGEPGGLLSVGSHRVGHDLRNLAAAAAAPPSGLSSYVNLSFGWDALSLSLSLSLSHTHMCLHTQSHSLSPFSASSFFKKNFFFYCSGFCHTLKWISHGFTCVPHPDPSSHLPLHPIPLGLPSAPGPSACLILLHFSSQHLFSYICLIFITWLWFSNWNVNSLKTGSLFCLQLSPGPRIVHIVDNSDMLNEWMNHV